MMTRCIKEMTKDDFIRAANMNLAGEGPSEISRQLGCSYNTADAAITRGLKLLENEKVGG